MAIGESPSRVAGEAPRIDPRTDFRALARRDITVPIGIDNISAISWYDISSTSRKKEGHAIMQRQIVDDALQSLGISVIHENRFGSFHINC
jgi:hypothetical protein